jgi:hypothetical protein
MGLAACTPRLQESLVPIGEQVIESAQEGHYRFLSYARVEITAGGYDGFGNANLYRPRTSGGLYNAASLAGRIRGEIRCFPVGISDCSAFVYSNPGHFYKEMASDGGDGDIVGSAVEPWIGLGMKTTVTGEGTATVRVQFRARSKWNPHGYDGFFSFDAFGTSIGIPAIGIHDVSLDMKSAVWTCERAAG